MTEAPAPTTPPTPRKNLRDALLDALRPLPGTRTFHIHVLQSAPRRHTLLYQFAKPRPKTYVQDILVLLSEQREQSTSLIQDEAPRVLTTAIEANLYLVPATSGAILYVCKVDSTGQTLSGASPTKALVKAFLKYFASPKTRPVDVKNLWIQLFARAQGQYLFPNSSMWEGKKPLSDVKLCAWWKRVLAQVGLDISEEMRKPEKAGSDSDTTAIQACYILPGYSQLEAEYSLKVISSDIRWEYGHPYSPDDKSILVCPPPPEPIRNLGHYIPYFDDDPKSRFLDEIAYTTGGEVKSPVRKRARTTTLMDDGKVRDDADGGRKDGGKYKGKEKEKEKDDRPLGELAKVTTEEFWERMSFRQECVAGAVTGFFTLIVSTEKTRESEVDAQMKAAALGMIEAQAGQVSSQINKRVLAALTTGVEFSTAERAIKATETLESTIKGLCEGIGSYSSSSQRSSTPEPREGSRGRLLEPPRTPPRNEQKQGVSGVTPNAFPEPVTSLETYQSYIYGCVWVSNPDGEGKGQGGGKGESGGRPEPGVTKLTARKKKKRGE